MPHPLNAVVFFTDQQRHDTTGLHGCPLDLTPKLDAWGRRGTHFAHAVSPQPVCGPARACLQTGRFATAVGEDGCHTNGRPLPRDADTLAKRFDAAGHATGYFGKWHLAPSDVPGPVAEEDRGGYRHWLAANLLETTSDAYATRLWDGEGREHRPPGYRVDAVTDAAIRFIGERSQAEQPFLCVVSHLEPHMQNHRDDYPAPAFEAERYAGRWTPPDLAALPGAHPGVAHLTGGNAQQSLGGYFGMCRRLGRGLRPADGRAGFAGRAGEHGRHLRERPRLPLPHAQRRVQALPATRPACGRRASPTAARSPAAAASTPPSSSRTWPRPSATPPAWPPRKGLKAAAP